MILDLLIFYLYFCLHLDVGFFYREVEEVPLALVVTRAHNNDFRLLIYILQFCPHLYVGFFH